MEGMDPVLLTGTASPHLGRALGHALGITATDCHFERFPDGEMHVQMPETVRGRTVVLVQTTTPPAGEHLLELLLMADACWRAGAARLEAVVPYLGYARQDRRAKPGEALGGRLVADLLSQGRFSRMLVVDLHSPALEGCFG
ncbi:ribose-phosphate diphosphokinase, partial [Pyxidicoccus sp. 3LG]